jgi:branched-subunit amino acid ABC-type transport system permease component
MQMLINGLAQGAIIAIAAMGITLIFRISHFANASFGDLMTIGAYSALGFSGLFHLPLFLSALLGVVVTAVVGGATYLVIFKSFEGNTISLFAASIGLALALRACVQYVAGTQVRVYGAGNTSAVSFLGARVPLSALIVLTTCAGVGLLFFALLRWSVLGKKVRATADSESLARVTGISVRSVTVAVWLAASGLAGLAGVLLGVSSALSPDMGWNFLLSAFAAAILGGLGSISAAVVGGLLIGLAEQLSILIVPAGYKPAIAFTLMVLVLLLRPTGLFAAKARA